ncbi:MAG: hypothetical protein K9M57_08065 [Phycisphaerae bacterium]|nr:hypothetical protein [Phycisphaerae bacterium]
MTDRVTGKPNEGRIASQLSGRDINQLRIIYPIPPFNRKGKTKIQTGQKTLRMPLGQMNPSFEILNAPERTLTRTGQTLKHRNGLVERVYFDACQKNAQYRIAITISKQ